MATPDIKKARALLEAIQNFTFEQQDLQSPEGPIKRGFLSMLDEEVNEAMESIAPAGMLKEYGLRDIKLRASAFSAALKKLIAADCDIKQLTTQDKAALGDCSIVVSGILKSVQRMVQDDRRKLLDKDALYNEGRAELQRWVEAGVDVSNRAYGNFREDAESGYISCSYLARDYETMKNMLEELCDALGVSVNQTKIS